jgi:hypothetical protein
LIKKIRNIAFLVVFILSNTCLAQFDKTRGYARNVGGVSYFKPFNTSKLKTPESWIGVNFRLQNLEFGIHSGRVAMLENPTALYPFILPILDTIFPFFQKSPLAKDPLE